jgi:hypothetical protein
METHMDWPCWEMDEGIIDLTQNVPLPVKGYTGQSNDNVALANRLKEAEERYLRELDELDTFPNTDKRMVALARTNMQTAAMWAVRSIFQPTRVKLPEDSY